MSYAIGLKALRRLCIDQDTLVWQRAKLSNALFKPYEQPIYAWVTQHLKMHHVLPNVDTLVSKFPDLAQLETVEPASYYVQLLENRYFFELINQANLDSQEVLKKNQDDFDKALDILREVTNKVMLQKYRLRILDVGAEAFNLIISAYHSIEQQQGVALFGWPYMDSQSGGVMPGDLVSFVGRPNSGKTWLTLWTALQNWNFQNVLFVSMEMMTLPITQRIAAMYTKSPVTQLKNSEFSTPTYNKFIKSLHGLILEQNRFYVIDGNLAASVEDIFTLADALKCKVIVIDGGYLVRHRNIRLDRFNRAAENSELIKRYSTDLNSACFVSWQLSREATKKQKKSKSEEAGLEDIGYSDAIGQISSIVLGLFQEEGIETMTQRIVRVMKGRNGETGKFTIAWDFINTDFSQTDPPISGEIGEPADLGWI